LVIAIGVIEEPVEELLKRLPATISMGVEVAAALIIAYGAIEAVWGSILAIVKGRSSPR
jgi:hypothetical protein